MKTLAVPLSAALLVLAVTLGTVRAAQDGGKPAPNAAPAPDAFHAGAEHALLQRSVGTWDAVLVAPDGKGGATRTKGVRTTTKHTDFHTLDAFEGDFMGTKLIGRGMNGYCTVRRKFFSYWSDSMTSSPLVSYGDWDEKARQIVFHGDCYAPSGKLEPCRTVLKFVDDDHQTWTLFGAGPDGKEGELLRIEYVRRR